MYDRMKIKIRLTCCCVTWSMNSAWMLVSRLWRLLSSCSIAEISLDWLEHSNRADDLSHGSIKRSNAVSGSALRHKLRDGIYLSGDGEAADMNDRRIYRLFLHINYSYLFCGAKKSLQTPASKDYVAPTICHIPLTVVSPKPWVSTSKLPTSKFKWFGI